MTVRTALQRANQCLQLSIGLLLRCFEPNQHFHPGQNQLSNGSDFAVMLVNTLFNGHFSLSAG